MNKIDKIVAHPVFRYSMDKIEALEKTRRFCCHGIEHSLDVARIAYIYNLESQVGYKKDMIYAAALLHDIGRWKQYEEGISHHEASEILAEEILKDIDFTAGEKWEIIQAIRSHREGENGEQGDLSDMIYRADKKSRLCWKCEVYDECYWPAFRKNHSIEL